MKRMTADKWCLYEYRLTAKAHSVLICQRFVVREYSFLPSTNALDLDFAAM